MHTHYVVARQTRSVNQSANVRECQHRFPSEPCVAAVGNSHTMGVRPSDRGKIIQKRDAKKNGAFVISGVKYAPLCCNI
ncbi:hypothetical protein HW555_006756 [Spodoptera exigua]|uniref:Uncharacterized protein n=1 Tax=Spodoptera exigua TaxID=7107 RepID=A0A835GI22_SPOEX|nr:hypothetical protein HW555_006756 [Spodoptera exigua]